MFGAGGAARAIGVEVALAGVGDITIVNRSRDRAQPLVDLLNDQTPARARLAPWDRAMAIPDGTDIVVNATSIGLFPNVDGRLEIELSSLKEGMVVADIIPNPPRTLLVREAEARGCIVIDGLGMLINQGVISIKYWTGIDVDPTVMRQELVRIFQI
jgi:shikimate dehydrogenase